MKSLMFTIVVSAACAVLGNQTANESRYFKAKIEAAYADVASEYSQLKNEFLEYERDLTIWSNAYANVEVPVKDKNGNKYADWCANAHYVEDFAEVCNSLILKYTKMSKEKFIAQFKREYSSVKSFILDSRRRLKEIDKKQQDEIVNLNASYVSDRNEKIEQIRKNIISLEKTISRKQEKHSRRLCRVGACSCEREIRNLERKLDSAKGELYTVSSINDASKEHVEAESIRQKYSKMRNEILANNDLAIAMNGVVDKYKAIIHGIGQTITERMENINSRAKICSLKLKNLDLVMKSDNVEIAANIYSNDLRSAFASLGIDIRNRDEIIEDTNRELMENEKQAEHIRDLERIKAETARDRDLTRENNTHTYRHDIRITNGR